MTIKKTKAGVTITLSDREAGVMANTIPVTAELPNMPINQGLSFGIRAVLKRDGIENISLQY